VTTGLMYMQVIFGAIVRHTGAHLKVHLLFAGLVVMHVLVINLYAWRHHPEQNVLVRPVMLLAVLLMIQLSLGLGAYLVRYTAMAAMLTPVTAVSLTTTHLAIGSLMLAVGLILTLRTYHLDAAASRPNIAPNLLPQQVS